jgi:probable F420-dependent oxidoreductase
MRLWLSLPFVRTDELREIAVAAEQLGVAGVAASDHPCVPGLLRSEYPYTGRRAVLPAETEIADPIPLITALGASTERLRFMTYVLIAPLRHPVMLAKHAATAAVLTGGRLDLGVGAGWMREEFAALGVSFEQRGSRLDEMLPLLRELWTGEAVEHHGRHFDFEPLAVNPRPARQIPILVGGHGDAALRRAARLADGWVGVSPTVDELGEIVGRLRALRAEHGTRQRSFEIRTGLKGDLSRASLDRLRSLDVGGLVVTPWQLVRTGTPIRSDTILEALSRVVAALR